MSTTAPPTSRPPGSDGPLGRFLSDPGASTDQIWSLLADIATQGAPFAAVAATISLLVVLARAFARRRAQSRWAAGAHVVEILAPPEVERASAEALWSNLVSLVRPSWARWWSGQPHLIFEITASAEGLSIGLWVPAGVPPGMVERAIEAAWPGARTTTRTPTPPIPDTPAVTGGRLRLARPDWFPIRTNHDADPLRAMLGSLADFDTSETAVVQILARPATGRRLASAHRAAAARRAGRPTSRAARLADLLTPGTARSSPDSDPERLGDVRSILDKASHPAWDVEIRYATATTTRGRQGTAMVRGRAHAIASAFGAFAGANRLDRNRLARPARVIEARRLGRGDLLSVPELAAVAHLPTDTTVVGLVRAGARATAPGPAIPTGGKVIGDSDAGATRPIALGVQDARHHLHVLGATGVGKSTLLTNLALSDIAARRGVVVIDPKGDLITDLLDRLPEGCTPVLIDPDDKAPPALNVLEGADSHLVVDNLVGIFRSIFERFWGPRTDDVLRSACLSLHHYAEATGASPVLTDVPRLLADEHFRRQVTAGITDPSGLGGFWAAYEAMGDATRSQVTGPLLNKLRAFLLRDFVRKVVGSSTSSFKITDVLDGRHPLLVRLPKGTLGEDTARLLGSFVVAQVWQAATLRARLPESQRIDAALYVDECQNFLTLPRSFDEMLAEARGYRLSLVLAHQHLAQLSGPLRDAISANARSKVWFNVSPEDARSLERHVSPELNAHDLAHLPAYTVAARLIAGGIETPAFTARTRPAPPPVPGRARAACKAAGAAFGHKDTSRSRRRPGGHRRRGTAPAGAVGRGSSGPSNQASARYSNEASPSHANTPTSANHQVNRTQTPRVGPRTP